MPAVLYPRHKDRLPPRTASGFKGVQFLPVTFFGKGEFKTIKKPWRAYGRHHAQFVCIGYFASKEEAARAYNDWALKVYGPETWLNPVPSRLVGC